MKKRILQICFAAFLIAPFTSCSKEVNKPKSETSSNVNTTNNTANAGNQGSGCNHDNTSNGEGYGGGD